ncbi:hypothetical protein CENSYa_1745 [Cenarchaeum symbiosum A]|uniref:Uncharacterized protein n=1 Tax=Cenarchaeum symbiosum (strain A) TaxID=414004 RepID=A0RYD9_CENSY|nr:hypothetical protein CENSYa_1745 [Cenarchaeum symbiosum A]
MTVDLSGCLRPERDAFHAISLYRTAACTPPRGIVKKHAQIPITDPYLKENRQRLGTQNCFVVTRVPVLASSTDLPS